MRLTIETRFKRKGAQPEQLKDDEGVVYDAYADGDLQRGLYYFHGSHEFRCVPPFITDERYGRYIDLESTSEDYKRLLQLVKESIEEDIAEDPEYYSFTDDFLWFIDSSNNTIYSLYALLLKAPAYEQCGWIIQLKAEWN